MFPDWEWHGVEDTAVKVFNSTFFGMFPFFIMKCVAFIICELWQTYLRNNDGMQEYGADFIKSLYDNEKKN